jgi:tetratricopeptide (TPR) repeat protein
LNSEKFFRKTDWLACGLTFLIALIVYTLTLQPTLGLEDSGELIVASDYLGVPHPPGYPIWSLLTWFFQWVFHAVTFHGQPNPAWAVNWFSAVSGAAACGTLALLISRSGMDILRSMKTESSMMGERTESLFCCIAGIAAGLLLAFGQGMWSQSVIAEVYALNIFFQILILLFLYRWMAEPANVKFLFLCAFTFGLGFTNHQTIMFMGAAIAIAILFRDFHMFRDFAITGIFFLAMLAINKSQAGTEWAWTNGPFKGNGDISIGFWFWTAYCIVVPLIARFTLKNGRTVCITFHCLFLGLAFYLYMPISSDQNPPINWGYPRTWQGFMHAITRGQYERVKVAHVLEDPARFIHQCSAFFTDLRSQYLPLVLTGFLPFAAWKIRKFNAALVAIVLFVIAAALFTLSTLIGFKAPDSGLAATLNKLADPFITGLFILFAIGFAMSITNFIEMTYHKCKEIWKDGGFWSPVSVVVICAVGAISALAGLYVGIKLLKVLATNSANQTASENAIIFLAAILPPVLLIGTFVLKKLKATQLTFDISDLGQHWFITTIVAFVATGLVFLIIWNPKTDIQSLFIGRVQFIQTHAIYAIWMGYGLVLTMAYVDALLKNNRIVRYVIAAGILALPLFLIVKNYVDPNQKKIVGGAEQNGHDFGWQFGNWQLRGVEGIKDDLRFWHPDDIEFEAQWAAYPDKTYPPPMGPNAIFFGGTDPGRFVPTYMIYSAKVRPDVYLITQNALADNTYMNVMRDLYGDQIWIPGPIDSNRAFQMYVDGVRSGKINAGADLSTEGGKVQVQGVGGVMQINGFLSKMIFDNNQYITETKTDEKTRPVGSAVVHEDPVIDPETGLPPQRTFYVEESYVLPWMYPYLTPHGLIMKINNKPTPLTAEIIKKDTDFWNWYVDRLLNDERFIRDIVARKSFSKLRSSLAGLYAARGKPAEAEAAFKQAVSLYDLSPEANFRLADMISKRGRYNEAIEIFNIFLAKDPNNVKAAQFRDALKQQKAAYARIVELEGQFKSGKGDIKLMLELMSAYPNVGQISRAEALARDVIKRKDVTPEALMATAQIMAQHRRFSTTEAALVRYTTLKPKDAGAWLNLATFQMVNKKTTQMWQSLTKAVEFGGEPVRNMIRKDERFAPLRNTKEYQKLIPPPKPAGNINLAPLPGL